MNKKRLSVVMAGAMLATSVAPVMAAEATTEATKVSANELGLLQEEVREIIENAPKFANEAENAPLGKEDVRCRSNIRSNNSKCKRSRILTGRSKKPSRKKCIR